jgi:glycosyltransferase involved in cell wall biosynthesis
VIAAPRGDRLAKRIGINVSWMAPGQSGGMEWYTRNLIQELGVLDDRHEWVIVTSPMNWHLFETRRRRWNTVSYIGEDSNPASFIARAVDRAPTARAHVRRALATLRFPRMRRWYGGLAELIRRQRLDLWFCPFMYALPVDTEVPVVNTIPDLQHEHFPEFFSDRELVLRTMGYRYSCQRAATTIAISEFVTGDLLERYRLERAVGIPLGLDPAYQVGAETTARLVDQVRLKYRLDGPFLYYPANGWRHKDHETLVRAFLMVREKRRDVRLVLSGCAFDVMDRLCPIFESLDEARAVRHLGYVDRDDTVGLYAAASVMVFPSRFEGFGLPLLEAMACGTPIVCSPVASIPEVAGDAVLYVDPGEPASLAAAVLRLLEDDVLRARLAQAGRKRVSRFSFTETARHTLAVFDEVLMGTWRAPHLPPFRPLMAHRQLPEGHGRWYFHCPDLREVRLRVAQPTRWPELAAQRITVRVNDCAVLETDVGAGSEHMFTIAPTRASTDLYRLDVIASATTQRPGHPPSLEVRELTLVDGDGRRRPVIE